MVSESVEEYLEIICKLGGEHTPVAVSTLAERLGISAVSANEMIKKLVGRDLVTYEPYKGVSLTPAGQEQALRVIRRHRLWERFLTDVLGLPWDQVHEEACRLEHATSPTLEEKLTQYLDEPESCPHGYPLAGTEYQSQDEGACPLSALEADQQAIVLRVSEDDTEMLRYIGELGLRPQVRLSVEGVAPFDGPLTIRVGGERQVIGQSIASRITVQPL
jgi:DtxR family Mn-dependent transcriptional regulator